MPQPGLDPPAGQVSNFANPDRSMFIACIASNAIAIPICTLFIGYMGYCAICLTMLRFGGGLHQWDVPIEKVPYYSKTVYATMVSYGPTVFATKAAILLFLIRIFAPYKVYVKWIYAFLGVMGVYYFAMMILKIFICRPISMFWGATTDGKCFNQRTLILVDNVISLVSDIAVLLLPCPLTSKLNVGLMAKIRLGAVFGVGGIACVFSLIRLVFIVKDGENPDSTYHFVQINLTGIAECGIGLVCACFPVLPGLYKSILRKEKPGYSGGSTAKSSQFEMMSSSGKRSRSATHNQGTIRYTKEEADSDENTLIHNGQSYVTTDIRAGNVGGGDDEDSLERSSEGRKGSGDGTSGGQIVKTVEVRQYSEQ
ncbi:hypothetical protein GMORB2_5331 [Geosmithia morbida]|uniref:Rhodopsin domain-containing protein n=1 Tax=Geosmithia morbida TaxID=1094350 RepID=A0A9P4YXH9_9HYPO|nr:uncharacterized protein GMORB2_5331 [Geosmithia morbida]KAF4124665.1 hypothetical protein GMORB2_5331 [Geosmithia morbida]